MTNDLDRRLTEHKSGHTQTTSRMEEQTLVYYEVCYSEQDAHVRERQLKTGFGRGYLRRRLQHYLRACSSAG